ncbi:MAG: Mov34/MPN/PAD-1 family protein [Deltaproteobacteria bacterium]|nr:Mov34/MPN/PAD-1 family protein [Deltaproteobacteria bacterium]
MSGDTPRISRQHLLAIYRQAREQFPGECCGFILGEGPDAELVQCDNVIDKYHRLDPESYPRTSANGYMLGVKDIRRLDDSFATEAPARVIYHSHPKVGAYFSDEDTEAAVTTGWSVDYLVVDVQETEVVEAILFRRQGDRYEQIARFDGEAV